MSNAFNIDPLMSINLVIYMEWHDIPTFALLIMSVKARIYLTLYHGEHISTQLAIMALLQTHITGHYVSCAVQSK